MPVPMPTLPRRIPESLRRRLEVHAAVAWQALVEAHSRNGVELVGLLAPWRDLDEIVDRYVSEMDIAPAMAPAVRNRILVACESGAAEGAAAVARHLEATAGDGERGAGEEEPEALGRFRPSMVLEGFRERTRRREERDRLLQLSLARAEETIILTHMDNAATFAELLEPHMSLTRAVEEYNRYLYLKGGRAQAVFQRTMARLADARLPPRPSGAVLPVTDARRVQGG